MSKRKVIIASIIVIVICVIGLIVYHARGGKLSFASKTASVSSTITSSKSGITSPTVKPITSKQQSKNINKVELVNAIAKGKVIWADTHKGIEGVGVQIVGENFTKVLTDKKGYYILKFRGRTDQDHKYNQLSVILPENITKSNPYIINPAFIPGLPALKVTKEGEIINVHDIEIQKTGGIIRGKVLKSDGSVFKGEELERVCVEGKIPDNADLPFNKCTAGMIHARLDKEGYYTLTGVPSIKGLNIKACAFGYMCQEIKDVKIQANKITNIDIIIPTNDNTGIEGIITDKQTGKPISGATVILDKYIPPEILKKPGKDWPSEYRNAYDLASALSNNQGRYFIKGIKSGQYTVFVMMYKYNAIHKEDVNGPIKIASNQQIKIDLALSPESKSAKSTIEYVKDPKANIDTSCGSNTELIRNEYNFAMSTFEGCMNSVYWEDLDSRGIINVSCTESCGLQTSDAEFDPSSGYIHICLDRSGNIKSSNLSASIFHEAVHIAGYDGNTAYAYAYKCLRGDRGYVSLVSF